MKVLSMDQVLEKCLNIGGGQLSSIPAFTLPTALYLPHDCVCNATTAIHTTTTAVIKTKLNQHLYLEAT